MKQDSLYSFVIREIGKNSFNRMNLSGFTRILKKKCQDVSSAQLLFVYKELQKMKAKNSQFDLSAKNINETNKQHNPKGEAKMQSYEKHALICLQQVAIKQKQKSGYQEGFDICKLLYYRLLNAIQFSLPHAQILDQFRQQFLWKELGEEIIDYVGLIEKDPSSLGVLYVETVNNIIQTVSEELETIHVLELPFLKAVLAKGRNFGAYNIDESLLDRLDCLINQNKYVYSFKELGSSLSSDKKHYETHIFYSLMSKDLTQKRLNYMMINQNNLIHGGQDKELLEQIKTQLGLPGKYLDFQNIDFVLKRITQLQLYGVYIDIFQSIHHQKQISKISLLRPYIQYHFTYFFKTGTANCKIQEINKTLNNTFENEQKMAQKGLIFEHLEILKLFLICQMLSKEVVNPEQMHESHNCLQKELAALNLIQKPKLEQLNLIFERSLKNIGPNSIIIPDNCINTLSKFIKNCEVKLLTQLISEDLSTLQEFQKNIVMNELILSLVKAILNKNMSFDAEVVGKVMEIFMKIQFNKFSTELTNVQKLLDLIKERSNQKIENKTN